MSGFWHTGNGGGAVWVESPHPDKAKPITLEDIESLRTTGYLHGARADSAAPVLRQIVKVDEYSGRKYYEYEGPKSLWMNQFKGPLQEQVAIHKDPSPERRKHALAEFKARKAAGVNRGR
jgi:hypothetical protein